MQGLLIAHGHVLTSRSLGRGKQEHQQNHAEREKNIDSKGRGEAISVFQDLTMLVSLGPPVPHQHANDLCRPSADGDPARSRARPGQGHESVPALVIGPRPWNKIIVVHNYTISGAACSQTQMLFLLLAFYYIGWYPGNHHAARSIPLHSPLSCPYEGAILNTYICQR